MQWIAACFFCFFLIVGYGQSRDTLFVDEGYVVIPKDRFEAKLRSKLYYSLEYELDTAVVQKLFLRYYLGHLKSIEKKQLFGILAQRNHVDTSQTILIHYQDTLKSRDSYPKKEQIVALKDGSHRHIPSYRTFFKAHKKCMKSYDKQDGIHVYHYFHHNQGHPTVYKDLEWYEDPLDLLRKLFYNKGDNTLMWRVFLYPNGDYLVLYGGIPTEMYKDLKLHRNWDTHYKKWQETYNRLNTD